ncbi:MAG: hypothetical protein ACK4UN_02595 [Limisphaerales bacterium]
MKTAIELPRNDKTVAHLNPGAPVPDFAGKEWRGLGVRDYGVAARRPVGRTFRNDPFGGLPMHPADGALQKGTCLSPSNRAISLEF